MDSVGVCQIVGLGVFLVTVVARAVPIRLHSGRNPIRLGAHNGEGQVRAVLLFVVMNLWIGETLRHVLWPELRPLPPLAYALLVQGDVLHLMGLAMMASGLGGFGLALHSLGVSWRLGIDTRRPGRLVTDGIHALSRHPICLPLNLYLFGAFPAKGMVLFLGFAVLMAVLLHGQILQEKRFLLRVFGGAYGLYCTHSGRYVTWHAPRAAQRPAESVGPEPP